MQKGIKFRAYPNKEQQNLINQTLGCCRLIYNKGLAMRDDAYSNGEKIGYYQTSAMLTGLKKQADFWSVNGISTTTYYYNYRKYIRLSQSTNKQSNDTIEHLSNALDDINMEFFGGNLKTITITLGNGRSRNYRRTNGGAR